MKTAILFLFIVTGAFAENACVKSVSNYDLATEVFNRLTGTGPVSSSATVNYYCENQYMYFLITSTSEAKEVKDYMNMYSNSSCLEQLAELNQYKNRIPYNSILTASVCVNQYMYRLKFNSDLTYSKNDYINMQTNENCLTQARLFNKN